MKGRGPWMRAGVVLLLAAVLAGCAAGYSRTMGKSLGRVQSRDWEGALASSTSRRATPTCSSTGWRRG